MENEFEKKRKLISIGLIVIAVIIIVIMAVSILSGKNKEVNNTINYTTNADGNKVNTSEEVAEDKKVGNILIEKSQIVYENGAALLTSKVTNDSVAKTNLRFTVKFIANDGSVIAESVGFVGAIAADETKYINSSITNDVSNAKSITYEIME